MERILTERFERALVMAARLHGDQNRKGSDVPYVAHLLAVTGLVLEYGGDEDAAIAALLHDAAEDQGGRETLERIRAEFGDGVADVVLECSDTLADPKPPWRRRKEAYLASIPHRSRRAILVTAADKLHNARCILAGHRRQGEEVFEIFRGGTDGTLWYYGELTRLLDGKAPEGLVQELERVVAAIERRHRRDTAEES